MGLLLRTARKLGLAAVEVELLSPLPVSECTSRLQAAISPFGSLLVAGPVFGEINAGRLRARKHIVRQGRFQAHLVADLIDNDGQTRIKCRFTLRLWELCLFAAGLVVFAGISISAPSGEPALVLPFILVGGVGVLGLMLYIARKERRFLLDFLGDVVGAREVQKAACT